MRSLVNDILQTYLNPSDPVNHIIPLIRFIQAIDNEVRYMNYYIILAKALKRSHLIKIFPTNAAKIKEAIACKERLAFVKTLFVAWTVSNNAQNFFRTAQIHDVHISPITRIQEQFKRIPKQCVQQIDTCAQQIELCIAWLKNLPTFARNWYFQHLQYLKESI